MLKNLLLYTNDFLALFVMQLTIITVISIQIYALIKVKSLQRKYYIFLLIKILEIIFFKYEIFYMYLILFIIGVILNISLAIRGKKIDIKEMILGTIIFSTVPLIITFGILYLILLNFIYDWKYISQKKYKKTKYQ